MKARSYYFFLIGAIFLDAAALPLVFGASWMFKAVWAVLPFILLFAPGRHLTPLMIITLAYFRAAGSFNLGILFLGLVVFLMYERWFLTSFFNKIAWQSLILASGGIAVFNSVVFGLDRLLVSDGFYFSPGIITSVLFSMIISSGLNFLLSRTHHLG